MVMQGTTASLRSLAVFLWWTWSDVSPRVRHHALNLKCFRRLGKPALCPAACSHVTKHHMILIGRWLGTLLRYQKLNREEWSVGRRLDNYCRYLASWWHDIATW